MRRREGWLEKLYRFRGIALLIGIPLLLVALLLVVMPHRSGKGVAKSLTPDTFSRAAVKMDTIPAGQGSEKYCIIFDAGSTGSRVHVYKFLQKGGQLDLQSDTFEQLKPGLSSYADAPEEAAKSLIPLLETALKTVPTELQASTKIKLGATAGLRLLPEGKADIILGHVLKFLKTYPFQLDDKLGVTILDGADEGAFAWLTLNYLLGHLGEAEEKTVAAIDLGGGSVQQAFAIKPQDASKAPPGYITQLSGGGRAYSVYVHSYLGFGLMAGRAAVLSWEEAKAANPCVLADHQGAYEYGGMKYELIAHPAGPTYDACSKLVKVVLRQDLACGAPQQCAFNGAWGGGAKPSAFYVSSYFWDRATDAGIIGDKAAITWVLKPNDFSAAASKACSSSVSTLSQHFPNVEASQAPYLCLDLTFLHTLLTEGFRIKEGSDVSLVKRVKYQAQEIEAAWPLGAAINLL
ncbi:apyrase [Coccomyxa subellipsoidea C-169]|uniref:Apyrase n=1 Tax=Coccomyxa subellipsoidea (strain C-169) TaxID=574566 RepID=I0Z0Z2_COCSC|nr:apyrase [Coccomyxa subellipsoidea C-169]EIE24311.1 apyrase [Coccomyxa subellipsoidea C-169]|eukprot:XP_005648855.1 apyrase [Coccomyxa subellipsoidea C-169]